MTSRLVIRLVAVAAATALVAVTIAVTRSEPEQAIPARGSATGADASPTLESESPVAAGGGDVETPALSVEDIASPAGDTVQPAPDSSVEEPESSPSIDGDDASPPADVDDTPAHAGFDVLAVHERRSLELDDMRLDDAAGLAASPAGDVLFIMQGSDPATVVQIGSDQRRIGTLTLGGPVESPASITYDAGTDELVAIRAGASLLERVRATQVLDTVPTRVVPIDVGIGELLAGGFAIDRQRDSAYAFEGSELLVLDLDDSTGAVTEIVARHDLSDIISGPVRGLSVNALTGNLFIGDGDRALVIEPSGEVVRALDLSEAHVTEIRDLEVAASFDRDDAADVLSLYVLHDGGSDGPRLVELSTEPASVLPAYYATTDSAVLVQVITEPGKCALTLLCTVSLAPDSPDSSGLTYMPSNGHLLMSDGEVNEYSYYDDNGYVNLWQFTTAGVVENVGTTADTAGSSSDRWSDEPTGITFDEANNRIFTTDDTPSDPGKIYEVDIGSDGHAGTDDDTKTRTLDTDDYGTCDPEGITYDTTRGWLHVACGSRGLLSIDPGPDGDFGGVDDVVFARSVSGEGVSDAEGIAYNEITDSYMVIDYGDADRIVEYAAPSHTYIRHIDTSDAQLVGPGAPSLTFPAGGTWAPSSQGTGGQSLWIVDRGTDSSSPIDGKVFEFTIPGLTPGPDIRVGPSPVDFGTKLAGSGPFDKTVTVTNVGTTELSVSSALVNSGGPEFAIPVGGGGGSFDLASGATHEITIRYDPTAAASHSGNLQILSNDPDTGSLNVPLSGDAVEPNVVVTPPISLPFGPVEILTTSELTVNVANDGTATADLHVSSTSVSGSVMFSVDPATAGPFTLAPGDDRDVTVRFSPTSLGFFPATSLTVASDDPDSSSIPISLTGQGVPEPIPDISASPPSIDFGSVSAGATANETVAIENVGTADLMVTSTTIVAGGFTVVTGGAPFTVKPGASHDVTVRFGPLSDASFVGELSGGRRGHIPLELRHRGSPGSVRTRPPELPAQAPGHVRLRGVGQRGTGSLRGTRSARYQADLLLRRSREVRIRQRDQGHSGRRPTFPARSTRSGCRTSSPTATGPHPSRSTRT